MNLKLKKLFINCSELRFARDLSRDEWNYPFDLIVRQFLGPQFGDEALAEVQEPAPRLSLQDRDKDGQCAAHHVSTEQSQIQLATLSDRTHFTHLLTNDTM